MSIRKKVKDYYLAFFIAATAVFLFIALYFAGILLGSNLGLG